MEYFAKPQASSAVKIVKPEGGDVQLPPFTKPPKKGASNAIYGDGDSSRAQIFRNAIARTFTSTASASLRARAARTTTRP